MQIITITLDEKDGQIGVSSICSDGVTPEIGESACRFIADQFRQAAIEAEVERRIAEREAEQDENE
jgi:hypothetical protein